MRLQAAAALLAVTPLVGAVQKAADVSLEEKKRRRLYEEAASSSLLRTSDETKKKKEESSWKAVHLKKRAVEKHTDDQQIGRECDPTQNMDDDEKDLEADLGFLSCDPDEECVNSELSKTGGVCIKVTAQIHRRKMQTRRMQSAADRCADPSVSCDCSNIDLTTYVGSVVCTYEGDTADGYCNPSGDYCYTVTFTAYYSGYQYFDNYAYCFNFTKGPFDSICQLLNPYDSTCEIDVDGVMCQSCIIGTCPTGSDQETGLIWNCAGTTLDSSGAECEGDRFLPFELATDAPSAPPAVPVEPETTAPVTVAPVTVAPVTAAPVTAAPVTAAPVTAAPVIVTAAPVTGAPSFAPSFVPSEGPSSEPTAVAATEPPSVIEETSAPSAAPVVTTTAPITAAPVTAPPTLPPSTLAVTPPPVTVPPTPPPATEPPTVLPVPVTNPPTVFPVTEPPVAPRPDTRPPTGGDMSMSMSYDARRMLVDEDFMDEAELFEFGRRALI